jgi:hypothetical protein
LRWYKAILGLGLILALCAAGAQAEEEVQKVPLRVKVTHLSDSKDGVDPKARKLVNALKDQHISYPSAKVVREITVELAPGDVKTVKIGNGRKAHLQLMQADEDAALVAVDVEGGVKVDAKVRRGRRPLVLDAGKVGDGKRVLSIEAK